MDFTSIGTTLSDNPVAAIPVLFLAGVLTSFTPCASSRLSPAGFSSASDFSAPFNTVSLPDIPVVANGLP